MGLIRFVNRNSRSSNSRGFENSSLFRQTGLFRFETERGKIPCNSIVHLAWRSLLTENNTAFLLFSGGDTEDCIH